LKLALVQQGDAHAVAGPGPGRRERRRSHRPPQTTHGASSPGCGGGVPSFKKKRSVPAPLKFVSTAKPTSLTFRASAERGCLRLQQLAQAGRGTGLGLDGGLRPVRQKQGGCRLKRGWADPLRTAPGQRPSSGESPRRRDPIQPTSKAFATGQQARPARRRPGAEARAAVSASPGPSSASPWRH